jgi:AraC-like DNA-binding protein
MLGLTTPSVLNQIIPRLGIYIFPSSLPLNFLIGPILYFYFRLTIKKKVFQLSHDYKHLLIFAVAVVNMIPFYLISVKEKMKIYTQYPADMMSPFKIKLLFLDLTYYYTFGSLVTIFYLIFCFTLLLLNKDQLANKLKIAGYQTINNWLTWLYITFIFLFAMNIVISIRSFYLGKLPEPYYFMIVAFILFVLNIKLYQFPSIMYGIKFGTQEISKKYSFVHAKAKISTYQNNLPERFTLLLTELYNTKELFQQDYSIDKMADALQTSTYSLNKFLREKEDCNFSQLVYKMRIQFFIREVKASDFKKYSLNGLVKLYGFTSTKQFKQIFNKYSEDNFDTFMIKKKKYG